jgi:hypothetical protein
MSGWTSASPIRIVRQASQKKVVIGIPHKGVAKLFPKPSNLEHCPILCKAHYLSRVGYESRLEAVTLN